MEYLSWLGGKVEPEVRGKIDAYTGRRRLLKAALTWIEDYERELSIAMLGGIRGAKGLSALAGIENYGITDHTQVHLRVPTFTFNVLGADPHAIANYLWEKHAIAVLAENHGGFYSRTLQTYGKSIAVRASPVHFNTVEEIETFLHALSDAVRYFRS